jgi:hypothetical protein
MSNNGLIINNKRYTSISGPVGFVVMYPKIEKYYSWIVKGLKLPVFMFLGDYHDSGDTMCSDIDSGVSITSQEWYKTLDDFSTESRKVQYYIETYLGKPRVDTFKTQPIRWVTQNFFECISNRNTCPTTNIEWKSSEIRYEAAESCVECSLNFILINTYMLLKDGCEDTQHYINDIKNVVNTTPFNIINAMLNGDYKQFLDILFSETSNSSVLCEAISKNPVLNNKEWWKDQFKIMYNLQVDEYSKLSDSIASDYTLCKPVLDFIRDVIQDKPVEFDTKLLDMQTSLLSYVINFFLPIIDMYTLMNTFTSSPSLVVYNAGNKHIKLLTKYLSSYFSPMSDKDPVYENVFPKIWGKVINGVPQKCINIKYNIDLNKILDTYSGFQIGANEMKKVLSEYSSVDIQSEIANIKNKHTVQTQHIKNKLR